MINTTVIGNLGSDAAIKSTQQGTEYAQFRMASSEMKDPIWVSVVMYNPQSHVKNMVPYLKKGASVVVVGRLQAPRTYQNQKTGAMEVGLDIVATDIQFVGGNKKKEDETNATMQAVAPVRENVQPQGYAQPAQAYQPQAQPTYQHQAQAQPAYQSQTQQQPGFNPSQVQNPNIYPQSFSANAGGNDDLPF